MKLRHNLVRTALGAALITLATAASVQAAPAPGGETVRYVEGQGARFESLAGSRENLSSLASGLRSGREVTLVEPTSSGPRATTFTPATRPMGYGNVTRSLDLANRQLAANGITNPTAAQLRAALNGGTVTTARGDVKLDGVLRLRSQGMGWGKVAHTIGVPPSGKANAKALAQASPAKPAAGRTPESVRNNLAAGPGKPPSPGFAGSAPGRGNAFDVAGAPPGGGGHGPMGGGGGGGGHGRGR